VILPDEGYRYQETVYNDAWLQANRVRLEYLPPAPVEWSRPYDRGEGWSRLHWRRRAFRDVIVTPTPVGKRVPV
jgi:hypothetical protein